MAQNGAENFKWDAKRERAAALVAAGELTEEDIADELGVGRRTLVRWKGVAEFSERVAAITEETRAALLARGIRERQNRINAINDRWERMKRVIEARAEEHGHFPGGATGLLVCQRKGIGSGENFQVVDEYAVDTGLLREMREHEKQAAIEVGEWAEKHEHTGKDGGPIETSDASLTDEQRAGRIAAILDAARARRDGQASGG